MATTVGRTIDKVTAFFVGLVVGGALVAIVLLVIGPTRRFRAEAPIDDEVETRILLGIDPEPEIAPVVEIAHPRDYTAADIKRLEDLSKPPKRRKRT